MTKNVFQLSDEEKRQFIEDFRKRSKIKGVIKSFFKNIKKKTETEEIKDELKEDNLEK
jgi:hypothetical protein